MFLLEILLPLAARDGSSLPKRLYDDVRRELTAQFGGLTAFSRAPAEGLWAEGGEVVRDDIVVFEVMTEQLDRDWWGRYRQELELRFEQDEVVVRAHAVERL